jgi:hypothetical protein
MLFAGTAGALMLGMSAIILVSPREPPAAQINLGVFEPARGRIVYRFGSHLEAVDPVDFSSSAVVASGDLGLDTRVANFSADGARLALDDSDGLYILEASGLLKRLPIEQLSLWRDFMPSPWLSPDGTEGLVPEETDQGDPALSVLDLQDPRESRSVELQPPAAGGRAHNPEMPAWSPDGTLAAYRCACDDVNPLDTGVEVADLSSGSTRVLTSGWRVIRQLVWSPDGSRLLMVASRKPPEPLRFSNELARPQPSGLVVVDVDDGDVHEIATGHYVAAAWSPDGTQVAAIDFPGERAVVMVNADGSGGPQVVAKVATQHARGGAMSTGVAWHPIPPP